MVSVERYYIKSYNRSTPCFKQGTHMLITMLILWITLPKMLITLPKMLITLPKMLISFYKNFNSQNAGARVMYCLKTLIIITTASLLRDLVPREASSQGGK